VQVCGRGEALYDSQILPRDPRTLNYDPLALVITEARKYNISVHAWINTFYVWSAPTPPSSPEHVVNKHPEWIMSLPNDQNKYLDPTIPAVREHVKSIYLEVARNYAVDGVHLDYVRYPGVAAGYTAQARQIFARQYGIDPLALKETNASRHFVSQAEFIKTTQAWDNFRREAVNSLVRSIHRDLAVVAPEVQLTAAVKADADSARTHQLQDWAEWMRAGYIDAVIPMIYSQDAQTVQRQTARAAELSAQYSIPVLIGLGAWRRSADEIITDVEYVRQLRSEPRFSNLHGVVLFSYDGIKDQPDYLAQIRRRVFANRVAHVPPRDKRVLTAAAN
jgi:uncharacterized lipoprotein YddW (UPF0748 family)